MDPYYEHRLRNEVIYLHSLWHQGPPTISSSRSLQPSTVTEFKKKKKTHRGKRREINKKRPSKSENSPTSASNAEWPCQPLAESEAQVRQGSTSAWPDFKSQNTPNTQLPPSAEDQARLFANELQQSALKATQEFFASKAGSDGDDGSEGDDDDDGEFEFFVKLFEEDCELRGYYDKNYEKGDFSCLVCGGIGKAGKCFKDCAALLQHSIAIVKTKRRLAHRALARAICKVLGWNFDRLPTIVLSPVDPPCQS